MLDHQDQGARKSFESFNARFLTAEEIANTFVPPPQYSRLIQTGHSVLLGPRGSGKTTLLKMLQLKSLLSWAHPDAATYREAISFHSVFLGTDVLWGSQLEAACKSINDIRKRDQIRRTSFRIHLCLAFLKSLGDARNEKLSVHPELGEFYIAPDDERDATLAKTLSKIWCLPDRSTSLLGVRLALRSQLTELQLVIERLIIDSHADVSDYINLHPVQPVINAFEATNEIFECDDRRWGILCDELEIAPDLIRHDLFELLRSTSHNVIFKFSLFPYASIVQPKGSASSPTGGNDYDALNLSYPYRETAYPFCEALFRGMLQRRWPDFDGDPVDLLGEGWFDGGRSTRKNNDSPYEAPHGKNYLKAVDLAKKDRTFSRWLKQKNIVLRQLHGTQEDQLAQFRKAMPFILTRSEYLGADGKLRSRKSSNIYAGAYSLFSFTEGNPRIFINLMRPLIEHIVRKKGTVSHAEQSSSLDVTMHRYKASLSAIPSSGEGDIQSIMQLVDIIGRYLQLDQLIEPFSPEPPTTIEVDKGVSQPMLQLLGRAINAGVMIPMPLERGGDAQLVPMENDLVGRRLRLAYTLAPSYKLPLVSGRTVSLSQVLHARVAAMRRKPEALTQYTLPLPSE